MFKYCHWREGDLKWASVDLKLSILQIPQLDLKFRRDCELIVLRVITQKDVKAD